MSLVPTIAPKLVNTILSYVPSKAVTVSKAYSHLESEIIHEPRIRERLSANCMTLLELAWNTDNIKLFRMILFADFITIPHIQFLGLEFPMTPAGKSELVKTFCESKYLKRVPSILNMYFDDACEVGNLAVLDVALQYKEKTVLLRMKSLEVFRHLYSKTPIDITTYSLLVCHYISHNTNILKFLLEDKEKLGQIDLRTTITDACADGDIESVQELLRYPAFNPSVRDNEPIRYAFNTKQYDVIRLLLADSRVTPPTWMLSISLERGRYDFVLELLKDGRFDVNLDIHAVKWAIKDKRDDIVSIYRDRATDENREIIESLVKELSN